MAKAKQAVAKPPRSRKAAKAAAPAKQLAQDAARAKRVAQAQAKGTLRASPKELEQAVASAQAELDKYGDELMAQYGVPKANLDVHIVEDTTVAQHWANRRRNLALALSLAELAALDKKARESMFSSVMWLWGKNLAQGPADSRNLEQKAKAADSLARMLEKQGNDDGAAKARARAEALRRGERPELPQVTTAGAKVARGPREQKVSAASRFRELILAHELTDEAIFKQLQGEFALDDSKHGYVQWYRNDLKKKGLLAKDAGPVGGAAAKAPREPKAKIVKEAPPAPPAGASLARAPRRAAKVTPVEAAQVNPQGAPSKAMRQALKKAQARPQAEARAQARAKAQPTAPKAPARPSRAQAAPAKKAPKAKARKAKR